jgi:hypothetical protein
MFGFVHLQAQRYPTAKSPPQAVPLVAGGEQADQANAPGRAAPGDGGRAQALRPGWREGQPVPQPPGGSIGLRSSSQGEKLKTASASPTRRQWTPPYVTDGRSSARGPQYLAGKAQTGRSQRFVHQVYHFPGALNATQG